MAAQKPENIMHEPFILLESKRKRIVVALFVSAFIWFFLFLFGVYDLDYFSYGARFIITFIYGFFGLITILINLLFLQDYVIKNSTTWKFIYWTFWLMFCIGISNFLITTVVFRWEELSIMVFAKNQLYVLGLGIIVIPFIVVNNHILLMKVKINDGIGISAGLKQNNVIDFVSIYNDEIFAIDSDKLLFLQSADNYIDINFVANEQVKHKLIRNTLKYFEESNPHATIARCHRSYMINVTKIRQIKASNGNYSIVLEGAENELPLSRKFKQNIKRLHRNTTNKKSGN